MSSGDVLNDVMQSGSWLISADDLAAILSEPTVKVFDIRGTWATPARALPEDYAAGHIPGAAFLDWTKDFLEQDVPLNMAQIADEAGAARAFKDLGIDPGDLVVLYDDYAHMQAGRIWMAMRHWGFADVRVLNGGWGRWQTLELPTSTETPKIEPGAYTPRRHDGLVVELDTFLATQQQSCVIDGRGAQNYVGNPDDPRTGHIPGSLNVPFRAVLDEETGCFLTPDGLAGAFEAQAAAWRDMPIIATCGSGYAATVVLLALSELGRTGKLFDGSFAHWKQDPARAVAQGEEA